MASSSWDKTVRLWDIFERKGSIETFTHTHDVLTVAYRPDGRQLASSTLDGIINFWDPIDGLLMHTIEGRRDIAGGRLMTDRRSAANSSSGKYFTSLCYSADGSYILAGGSSRYICMYDVADQVNPDNPDFFFYNLIYQLLMLMVKVLHVTGSSAKISNNTQSIFRWST